jgi:Fe-S-cluster containining protein
MSASDPSGAVFACRQCGACCRVPGPVRLEASEVGALAAFLDLDVYAFTKRYTQLTKDRQCLTLTENEDGSCVFLQPDHRCLVQHVKPLQCKEFPAKWHFSGYEKICRAMNG